MSLSEEHILHKHTLVMALIANAMQGTGTTLCARRKPSVYAGFSDSEH